ncbi:uncharacterized protein LOC129989243 [Argiope bruennichi]|uniref:uncharacterized protein LOC129989243 n=2 Tax=Argiope bruennichi TaxID=94029 RepID=UPI002494F420|nr:uncharacterized protein LOC129968471 isoform X1 [Argiope bruennichi]XP_055938353.1 uncharacterized protein LOC129968471 isoform X1 [Argiope bruennichi]XP_055938354.1 uncharacterized protein LOC129968471 isoform X1 [Argiope bruennichi]XP_055939113.1 uncharacterized protein LOC129968851 isoform X1 [Argiope bruennichi]XP_055939114.1 uncharacterized protein LOC129968851 isoform X1 [Argiope bruennichi]XP_055939115.1 uncharacterized protein LOC129968851 isoform X1 [Argiope bruennichi]XP_05594988
MSFNRIESSFRGYISAYRHSPIHSDPYNLYNEIRENIFLLLLEQNLPFRLLICISIEFIKDTHPDNLLQNAYFCSFAERIISYNQVKSKVKSCFQKIFNSIETYIQNGSGWVINKINFLDVNIGQYREPRGGCGNIKLPDCLKKKRTLLNIRCDDHKCFIYSCLAHLFPPEKNPNAPSSYQNKLKYLKLKNVTFPMKLSNIKHFESINSLKINIFTYDKEVFPIYISNKKLGSEINLLLYKEHYFLIKNLNRLLNSKKGIHHYCSRCLIGFQRRNSLVDHKRVCCQNAPQKLSPPKINTVKFTSIYKMLFHPFILYADFECITKNISTVLPNTSQSFSANLEHHEPISFALIAINIKNEIIYHKFYCGENPVQIFLKTIKKLAKSLFKRLSCNKPMIEENIPTGKPSTCYICKLKFEPSDRIVRDHCHVLGIFRGFCHNSCNLNLKRSNFIPVVIHNLKGYDSHLLLKHMSPEFAHQIDIIPTNSQKFTSFTLDNYIKFIDSYAFLDSSLSSLVEILKISEHRFDIFDSFFQNKTNRNLLKQKGFFPYSYFSSKDILKQKTFPPHEAFFNILTNSNITKKEYKHALRVYQEFHCKNFQDYLELYQNTDTILLAEVFQSFRQTSMMHYHLDPAHFLTIADLTWHSGLKFTGQELKLLSNVEDYVLLETQMRGGICFLGQRYAQANNPYLSCYNPDEPTNYIVNLDVNNLYGHCMSEYLPVGDFRWLSPEEIAVFDLANVSRYSETGYLLEVDLLYDKSAHDFHDFPLAAEHLNINKQMLSDYQKKILSEKNIPFTECKKLTPNFYPKKRYILHYRNLKYYLKHGMSLKKIYRILAFSQSDWLRSYINFNNEKRQQAKSEFEKSFFKKMNNAFFGKTCQNVRKRINLKTALTPAECRKHLASPLLEYFESINEDFAVFKMKKINLVLDKPIYVGFCVLELAKLHMYTLYYSKFKKYYKENCKLLYTDTDSLFMQIFTNNVYKDFKNEFFDIMDLSNYPSSSEFFNSENQNKLGFLKDETKSKPISEFIGLRCKMYSYKCENTETKKAKGVKQSCLRNITHEHFKTSLLNETIHRHEQYSIQSKSHILSTTISNKISLSPFYDKIFLNEDGVTGKCFGHYSLLEE